MLSAGEQVVHIHSSVLGILPGMLCQDISCAQLQLRCFRLAFCFPQNSGVNPKALSVLRVPGTQSAFQYIDRMFDERLGWRLFTNQNDAMRIAVGQWLEEHAIDEAENGGVGADAKRQH